MLKSQFDTLETPQQDEPDVLHVNIDGSFEEVVERCAQVLTPYL